MPIPASEKVAAAMVDPRFGSHGYHSVNSLKFHYVETGTKFKARGPALLFLHGFPEFWYSWRNQLEALGKAHHCIAVDLRGYGWTDKPQEVDEYVIEKLVGDVKGLIHALGYGEQGVVLVGHDWGGNIAWYAAHMLGPELIKVRRAGCAMVESVHFYHASCTTMIKHNQHSASSSATAHTRWPFSRTAPSSSCSGAGTSTSGNGACAGLTQPFVQPLPFLPNQR